MFETKKVIEYAINPAGTAHSRKTTILLASMFEMTTRATNIPIRYSTPCLFAITATKEVINNTAIIQMNTSIIFNYFNTPCINFLVTIWTFQKQYKLFWNYNRDCSPKKRNI